MPYNPTLPVNGALVLAEELRAQFTGLKAIIDAQAATIATLQAELAAAGTRLNALENAGFVTQAAIDNAIAGTANNLNAVSDLPGYVASDPPLQSDVQQLADKLNEVINTAHR